jgi:hypothetical protein
LTCVDRNLDAFWHRRSPNTTVFSNKVNDTPESTALLDMLEREGRHLRPSETAAEKNGKDGASERATHGRNIRRA